MGKVHLIGNAHLDAVWFWRWQEGYAEVLATFRSALDRMKEFPEFKFTSAGAVYYQWVEKTAPDMFEEIKQRVKEGRWNIVGGWFLQPDCNIPDGESFARHGLVSQRYFKEKFGITVKTGYNVDSFGHNAGIPKILKNSGMDNYVFMRPSIEEKPELEYHVFAWESDDGNCIKTFRIPFCYNITENESIHLIDKIKEMSDKDNVNYMAFYGVGNHGGGPTIKLINEINKLDFKDMLYSTPDEYFADINMSKLPVIKDDLQHHAIGCYSAFTYIKKNIRKCEYSLLAAERLCVMAKEIVGLEYPTQKLNKAWKNLLFNQFHDIIGGCAIREAYDDAGYMLGETMNISEHVINDAMQKIAWNIDTLHGENLPSANCPASLKHWEDEYIGLPIVIFNPHPWNVRTAIVVNTVLPPKKMTDKDGNEIPFQLVRASNLNVRYKYDPAFIAEVPAMGYTVYNAFVLQESDNNFDNVISAKELLLENDKIRVEFDEITGEISKIYDKENDKYIIDNPCRAILLDETNCDTWAHNKKKLGEITGMFESPEFSVIEEGPVRASLRVITKYNNSFLQRIYSVIPGSKEIRVKVKVDFREKHRTLKFTFPLTDNKVISKIPYGTISRIATGSEEPCGSWIASGDLCVANDSKYGYDTENDEMRMTVLRSTIFADHYGEELRDDMCEYMEQGIHEFTYSLYPYVNNADAEKKAELLQVELPYISGSFHDGKLPESMSCFECDNENVIVSAIKQNEDSDLNIIRLYEMNGENVEFSLKLFGKEIKSELDHNEVKTFDENGVLYDFIEWNKQ